MSEVEKIIRQVVNENIRKLVLSNKIKKDFEYNKVSFSPIKIKDKELFQAQFFTKEKVFHKNILPDELFNEVYKYLNDNFKQANIWYVQVCHLSF